MRNCKLGMPCPCRARLKIQQEVSELSECTFKPATNTHKKTPKKYKPIQDRVEEMQQKKKEKIMYKKSVRQTKELPEMNHTIPARPGF